MAGLPAGNDGTLTEMLEPLGSLAVMGASRPPIVTLLTERK